MILWIERKIARPVIGNRLRSYKPKYLIHWPLMAYHLVAQAQRIGIPTGRDIKVENIFDPVNMRALKVATTIAIPVIIAHYGPREPPLKVRPLCVRRRSRMKMTGIKRSVLLIEDNNSDSELIARFLKSSPDHEYRLATAGTLGIGKAVFQQTNFDLILLDQNLPDSIEGETLEQCMKWSGQVPIIMLTGFGNEAEGAQRVRQGAQDYLVKGAFDAPLLLRVVRYTVERQAMQKEMALMKLREQKAEEIKALEAMDNVPSKERNSKSLIGSAPIYYADLIMRYEGFLDASLEQRIYRQERGDISEGVRAFTAELARFGAGPREIVEIHSAALEHRLKGQNEARAQAYLEEARLLLLETMGSMVQTYRSKFTNRDVLSTSSKSV